MLQCDSTFPFAGSSALYEDQLLPRGSRRRELARILERHGDVAIISLPLRIGATGNRRVHIAELIDGTALTTAEEQELGELRRALQTRSRKRKQLQRRLDELRGRQINQFVLRSEKAKWAAGMVEQRRRAA